MSSSLFRVALRPGWKIIALFQIALDDVEGRESHLSIRMDMVGQLVQSIVGYTAIRCKMNETVTDKQITKLIRWSIRYLFGLLIYSLITWMTVRQHS